MMITPGYDHVAVIHGFVEKCLRFFYTEVDIELPEYAKLEGELPEYAETIIQGGGYDLDQRIAALQAELDVLREALKDLLAWANIQDHHSAQAVSIRGRAWVALNRTPIQEAEFVPPPNDEDFMDM